MSSAETFIKQYLLERGASFEENNWRDYNFVDAGVIDSFETLSFLLVLNEEFQISLEPQSFLRKGFGCLGTLVNFVETHGSAISTDNANGDYE